MQWTARIRRLWREARALRFAMRDPRAPWYARWIIMLTLMYIVSPVDLIPDFLPIFGYLDDLVLIPFALWVAIRFVPRAVMIDCRARAEVMRPST